MPLERLSTQALANDVDQILISSLHFPSRWDRRAALVRAFELSSLDGAALVRLGADAAAAKIVTDAEAGANGSQANLPAAPALGAAFKQLLKPPAALLNISSDECGGSESAQDACGLLPPAARARIRRMQEDASDECLDPAAELTPYLCLGGRVAAENLSHLRSLGVTHVLNVADDVKCFFPEDLTYLHRAIVDGGHDDRIVDVFEEAAAFVRETSEKGGRVFVHCYAGINRSATVAIAVLMQLEGWTMDEAYKHIGEYRFIMPFPGNCAKIAKWEMSTRGHSSNQEWLRIGR